MTNRLKPGLLTLLLLGILGAINPAQAGQWSEVYASRSGLSYVDLSTVTHHKNLTQVMTMMSYDGPQIYSATKTYQATSTVMEFVCARGLVHAQGVVFYAGPLLAGDVVSKEGVISPMEPVPNGTPIEKIMRLVCD